MRLDTYLTANGLFSSRNRAQQAIKNGKVTVNGAVRNCGFDVKETDSVAVAEEKQYASLGAYKLLKALEEFPIAVSGKTAADIGASNGGFTQVLLEAGALRVYAVDVGETQLEPFLRADSRVTVLDHTNARYLAPELFDGLPELMTADVSFISLKMILPSIAASLAESGEAVVLVKPQFEVGAQLADKHGIVKSAAARKSAVVGVADCAAALGLVAVGLTAAPIHQGKNREYLLYLKRQGVPVSAEFIAETTGNV